MSSDKQTKQEDTGPVDLSSLFKLQKNYLLELLRNITHHSAIQLYSQHDK